MYSIAKCRRFSGTSKQNMANKLGVSKKEYSDFENYKKEMSVKQALIFAMETSVQVDNILFFAK